MQLLRRYEFWGRTDRRTTGSIRLHRGQRACRPNREKYHASLGVAYYSRGDVAKGDQELAAVQKLRGEQVALRNTAVEEANGRPAIERTAALGAVEKAIRSPRWPACSRKPTNWMTIAGSRPDFFSVAGGY